MDIIDAHIHLGECRVFGLDVSEQEILDGMDRNGINAAIIQPFPGCREYRTTHDRIANMASKYPQRVFGLCSLSPHRDRNEYETEVERCVKQLGFVALKLHTIGHAVLPLTEDGMTAFETAATLGIPLMVHTGTGIPFAQPSLCLPAAKKFPHLTIILAHAGFTVVSAEAQIFASEYENIYLETSWCTSLDIGWMVRSLGSERVMFGSDLPSNMSSELAKYRSLELDGNSLEAVLAGTARKVFRLRDSRDLAAS
jgi:uncharacterized protein